jgi:hypothetical protein
VPTTEQAVTEYHCSFCAKSSKEVDKLIAGTGVYICDACVRTCNDILTAESKSSERPGTPQIGMWQNKTDEELLAMLPKVAVASAQADAFVQRMVDLLRGRGVAWSRIGTAFGVTRQSAWEKYSNEE